jgi:hypothetical protein
MLGRYSERWPRVKVRTSYICAHNFTNVAAFSDSGKFRNIHVKGWETNPNGGVNFYDGKEVVSNELHQPDSSMSTDVLSLIALVDWTLPTSRAPTRFNRSANRLNIDCIAIGDLVVNRILSLSTLA